ncbi:MAG TPA: crosslink repair DNA glycosylase YcaQ family protein [Acidimicrobiales bacterium]|nr:crosslink repair DNA glycosylase YcaQ family protein [Acidimicrobiales bacterium]
MAPPAEMSLRDARRVALAAQGFADRRPTGRVDSRHFRRVLDRLATVQVDSVNVVTRSHELVFFARLGAYDRAALTRWLWNSRQVFEYWGHEASLHPVERQPLLRWRMTGDHPWGGIRRSVRDKPELVAAALAEISERGPVTISDLDVHRQAPRREASWWGWGDGKRVVEHLFYAGQVTATRRNGFTRAYMLPDRWIPADVLARPTPDADDARRELLLVAARAHGLGTARDLADYYRINVPASAELLAGMAADGALQQVRVEGWDQPAYLHPEARQPRRRLRARALLSPFDSLIWERARTERLFGFRYRIEIYVPAPKRVHGYYVLPFLLDERLVGRVDVKADRQAGVLRVRAAWGEPEAEAATAGGRERVAAELAAELAAMGAWLGLPGGVEVDHQGDLSADLAVAVAAAGAAPALDAAAGSDLAPAAVTDATADAPAP